MFVRLNFEGSFLSSIVYRKNNKIDLFTGYDKAEYGSQIVNRK